MMQNASIPLGTALSCEGLPKHLDVADHGGAVEGLGAAPKASRARQIDPECRKEVRSA